VLLGSNDSAVLSCLIGHARRPCNTYASRESAARNGWPDVMHLSSATSLSFWVLGILACPVVGATGRAADSGGSCDCPAPVRDPSCSRCRTCSECRTVRTLLHHDFFSQQFTSLLKSSSVHGYSGHKTTPTWWLVSFTSTSSSVDLCRRSKACSWANVFCSAANLDTRRPAPSCCLP